MCTICIRNNFIDIKYTFDVQCLNVGRTYMQTVVDGIATIIAVLSHPGAKKMSDTTNPMYLFLFRIVSLTDVFVVTGCFRSWCLISALWDLRSWVRLNVVQ